MFTLSITKRIPRITFETKARASRKFEIVLSRVLNYIRVYVCVCTPICVCTHACRRERPSSLILSVHRLVAAAATASDRVSVRKVIPFVRSVYLRCKFLNRRGHA